jgi:hypothetical protein
VCIRQHECMMCMILPFFEAWCAWFLIWMHTGHFLLCMSPLCSLHILLSVSFWILDSHVKTISTREKDPSQMEYNFVFWQLVSFLQAIVSLKKGAHLLKCGKRGKPKFCIVRLSSVSSSDSVIMQATTPLPFAS